jgi:hypothetical protein
MMKNTPLILWIVALVITVGSAAYQRMTGPTYPVRVSGAFERATYDATLDRSHGGDTPAVVAVIVPDASVRGELLWKRFRTDDTMAVVTMSRAGDTLTARMPGQPPAGKLEYYVRLIREGESLVIPPGPHVVIRFKGDVPLPVLIVHVLVMFIGMFISNRLGLVLLDPGAVSRKLIYAVLGLFVVGGLILGPVVQKYAFGAYWTGWPFGTDLTDNKTAVAVLAWLVALAMVGRSAKPKWWVSGAAVVTLVVFMIPHSLLGSELDYKALDSTRTTQTDHNVVAPGN